MHACLHASRAATGCRGVTLHGRCPHQVSHGIPSLRVSRQPVAPSTLHAGLHSGLPQMQERSCMRACIAPATSALIDGVAVLLLGVFASLHASSRLGLPPRQSTVACVRILLQVPRRVLGDFSLSPLGSSAPSCLRNPTCMHARVSRLEWPSDAGALLHARVVPLRFALSDGVQDTSGPPFSQLLSHPFMQACASDCHRRQSAVACVRSRPQVSHWVMGHFVSANPACMPAYRAATRGRIIVACMHRARKKSLCLWRCFLAHPGLH